DELAIDPFKQDASDVAATSIRQDGDALRAGIASIVRYPHANVGASAAPCGHACRAPTEIAMLRRFSRGPGVTRLMCDREQVIKNTQVSANAHRCGRANKK